MEYKKIKGEVFSKDLLNLIDKSKPLMFDTETIGFYGTIRLAQFYQKDFECPILVEYPDTYELIQVLNECQVVCHNASYDVSTVQEALGKISWQPKRLEDTFFLSRLYFYTKDSFTLDKCISYTLGYDPYEHLDVSKKELQKSDWAVDTLSESQKVYAAYDVFYMQALWDKVSEMCDDSNYKLDMITLKSNLRFQCNGLPVNLEKVNTQHENNTHQIEEIALPINCNSYKQVRAYIGSDKSNDVGLAELSCYGNKRAITVRRVRKLTKENNFLEKFTTDDGLIYGKFAPTARSGRGTCRDINLQQLPRSTKGCFGVEEGGDEVMIYSDFSQLELRCIASIVGEPNMVDIYRHNGDIHTYVGEEIFQTKELTSEQRRITKYCNFSLLYGGGAAVFARVLLADTGINMSFREATKIRTKWFKTFPTVKDWHNKGFADWTKKVPWRTPLGRRYVGRAMTDHLNIQIQGMGSEVAKLANYYMELEFEKKNKLKVNEHYKNWRLWQRNFVHDSYIFVLPNDERLYRDASKIIASSMQKAWFEMSAACKINDIGLPVEVFVGFNWGDIEYNNEYIYKYNAE